MTSWRPDLVDAGPLYLEIARAIEADVRAGRLRPGDRLPTHRALAEALGVTVGTVSRAYAEAHRRGLVRGAVGRGSFVQEPPALPLETSRPEEADSGPVDLSVNWPLRAPAPDLAAALRDLADASNLDERVGYGDPAGSPRIREAGARWLAFQGVRVAPDRVVVCAGAQHAIVVSLLCVAGPGEVVLAESLTYPGFLGAARLLGLRVRGVDLDGDGLVPDSLEACCRADRPRLLYCMPGLHNPTTARLSTERRQRIANIARRHDLTIVQDDVQSGLVEDPGPSLAELAPERVLTIASLSKDLLPGLRIAFLAGAALDTDRVREAVWSSVFMASPLGAEIATRWLEDGTARAVLARRRDEMRARHALAHRVLGAALPASPPGSYHLWLPLPRDREPGRFVTELEQRGVRVSAPAAFMAGRGAAPGAVRVSISGPHTHTRLEAGLRTIRGLLEEPPRAPTPWL
jgi:DNA-binding transcriptional MocR family regulator